MKYISLFFKKLLVFFVRLYQMFISPLFPSCCRFEPTCSAYFIQAVNKYGAFKGSYLGIKRILKCRPGMPGIYDPLK